MKKIFKSTLLLLCGVALFTACSDDNDSNPTVLNPASFQLNTPALATQAVDLASGGEMAFTWSQPDYGFPAPVDYQLQVSLDGNYTISLDEAEADESGQLKANYATLDAVFKEAKGSLNLTELATVLQKLAKWAPGDVPATQVVSVRATATAATTPTVYSNIVTINTVPCYVELSNAPINIWWLIGSDIADGSWGTDIGKSVIPLQPIEGEEYDKKTGLGKIQWTGWLAGGGFKLRGDLKDGWATQWGQGDAFGTFVKNDGGSGNITVPEAGYYTVTLETAKDELTIKAADIAPTVFDGMAISGSFNGWSDTPMNACSAGTNNHDWYVEQEFVAGDEFKVKQADSWDFNKGGTPVADGKEFYVFGAQNGPNIGIEEAGTYMIIFNDITGYIRYYKK